MAHIFRDVYSSLSVTAAAPTSKCPIGSDNNFGPQISVGCRSFDFTLLFEDSFFILLPAAVFLLLLPSRWRQLQHQAVKVVGYKLAIQKLVNMKFTNCTFGSKFTNSHRFFSPLCSFSTLSTQLSKPNPRRFEQEHLSPPL
jgi:hypothetical protein